ncbi:MAG: aldehyde dehydrogenase family protein [Granulosicoccaceae bacterium]
MSLSMPFTFDTGACFINGCWVAPASGEQLNLSNPSTGAALCQIARGSDADIDAAVNAAQNALDGEWGKATALQRGRWLATLGKLVQGRVEDLAVLEAQDVGKPLTQARADAVALARYCEFYAGAADKVHGDTLPYLDGYTVYTLREPHGVTGHIIPWNYPMQIIGRSVGAALTMGNAVVLKPAEQACLTALAFAELAHQAGFPAGAINVVPGLGVEVGAALAAHTGVQHISFTGSVRTGMSVQQAAAQNVIPVTLELGGKSAQLVFEDADIEAAMPFLINAGIQNAGQTCSAASRILVHRSIYSTVVSKMAEQYQQLRVGDAMHDLGIGPLISEQQRQRVQSFIDNASDLNCVATGQIDSKANNAGFFVKPMLFADVPPEHVLAQQEVFGPVQVVMPFNDDDHALALANGTEFGLVAAIWSRDGARQMRLAKKLRAGQVFINNYGAGGGVELPFGGVGKSGHGREKGFEALYGMSALKTVAARHD